MIIIRTENENKKNFSNIFSRKEDFLNFSKYTKEINYIEKVYQSHFTKDII